MKNTNSNYEATKAVGLVVVLCLVLASKCNAQNWKGWKGDILAGVSGAVAGSFWGVHEVTMHHYGAFERTFPGANAQFWNPAISWENKHKRKIPAHISDAKHLLASGSQIAIFCGAIPIGGSIGKKRWKQAAKRTLIFSGCYFLGNFVGYDLIKRN